MEIKINKIKVQEYMEENVNKTFDNFSEFKEFIESLETAGLCKIETNSYELVLTLQTENKLKNSSLRNNEMIDKLESEIKKLSKELKVGPDFILDELNNRM
ncbi:hypothetical protein [Fusobacterium periodonticum]|uniref:Uncharacterized protein n=1 Tax=Fusobacterium periodonticum ATCC 33693 TaxID=546275 RepID=D4CXF3_9FUSO|nr:hypothetical protein [Fusobacterium periodonticum]EFE86073.1 hypothetical protein FUSPEROL_02114 [Fusobacterium periodonticum ATCC 33693]